MPNEFHSVRQAGPNLSLAKRKIQVPERRLMTEAAIHDLLLNDAASAIAAVSALLISV